MFGTFRKTYRKNFQLGLFEQLASEYVQGKVADWPDVIEKFNRFKEAHKSDGAVAARIAAVEDQFDSLGEPAAATVLGKSLVHMSQFEISSFKSRCADLTCLKLLE
jgi:hypothetical protein